MDRFDLTECLTLLQLGDKGAFIKLYEEYKKPVFTVIYRIIAEREAAEDITQEFFIKLYENPPRSGIHNPRAWLFSIARNMAIDYLRRRKKNEALSADISVENDIALIMDAERAIALLPQIEREIVSLHLNCELTFAEIGKIIGLSLPSVYRRYRKALKSLRDYFEGG